MKTIALKDIDLLQVGNGIGMAGIVWTGAGKTFTTIFPDMDLDEVLENENEFMLMSLDEWKDFIRQMDIQETEILMKDQDKIIKSLFRKSQRVIETKLQWRVFERDNYTCRYTGERGIPLTVDHIDLWEEGGATIEENLLAVSRKANKIRGNMRYEDWIVSDAYKKISRNLPDNIKQANLDIVNQLPAIRAKRMYHVRSR